MRLLAFLLGYFLAKGSHALEKRSQRDARKNDTDR
jgi:hypothetical protein